MYVITKSMLYQGFIYLSIEIQTVTFNTREMITSNSLNKTKHRKKKENISFGMVYISLTECCILGQQNHV